MRLPTVTVLALIAVVGLNACATQTAASGAPTADAQPADAQPADDQALAELREHHRHHHRGGVTQLIAMSLDTLGADDASRPQIEKLQTDLYVCMVPAGEIEKRLLLALADGVAAGTIATAEVDAAIEQRNIAAAAAHDCSMDTLNRLHALLSPMERAALVDKVQAHWEAWRQVNHEAEAGGRERGGRLAELAQELSLTADQVEKISASLRAARAGRAGTFDPKKAEAHVQSFATAFVGESFDAKSVSMNANAHLATQGGRRMARFYEAVTPLLTPEQRTKLAEHLRERASHQPAISATAK